MRRNFSDWDTGSIGGFFQPGRAYTTQTGYLAPEEEWNFACAVVSRTPTGQQIAFGFARSIRIGFPGWTPTGFTDEDFTGHAWNPARPPEWLAAAVSAAAQAGDAKRARDLGAEMSVLTDVHDKLISAPWHPLRPGDLVHVHYGQTAPAPAFPTFGETYLVGDAGDGLLNMRLIAHTAPTADPAEVAGLTGTFAVEAADDPLYDLWFEAGPHRLTIVRDGRVVHDGARPPQGGTMLALALTAAETQQYLERGDMGAALARLRSGAPLPPCGSPGVMPGHQPCARPKGHGGACCGDAAYVDPPHECPALPGQLHAVVAFGAKVTDVYFAGLYEDREAAADHASGFSAYSAGLKDRYVKPVPGLPGEMVLQLPAENQLAATGAQLAVVVPLQVLPDPREAELRDQEGRDACAEYDPDCGKDLDDEDDYGDPGDDDYDRDGDV